MLYSATGTISGGTLAILWRGKPISLDDLIGKYCKSMTERNLSDNTITAYTHVVRSVYAYLDGKIDKQGLLSWKSWIFDVFTIMTHARGPMQDCGPIELNFASYGVTTVTDIYPQISGVGYGFARAITRNKVFAIFCGL